MDDAGGGEGEDLDLEGSVDVFGWVVHVDGEGWLAVGFDRDEDLVAGAFGWAVGGDEPGDVLRTSEPGGEGRHLPDCVVGEEALDRRYVVLLECLGISLEQLLVWLDDSSRPGIEPFARSDQQTVECDRAGVEYLGDLRGRPALDVAQDQRGPLSWWQVLQGGDEFQSDGVAVTADQRIGYGFEPEEFWAFGECSFRVVARTA